jgi:hypothetical protein
MAPQRCGQRSTGEQPGEHRWATLLRTAMPAVHMIRPTMKSDNNGLPANESRCQEHPLGNSTSRHQQFH